MLKIESLSKRLEDKNVLQNISFEIHKGSITGLIGRNGAGKTTLIRTIVGILDKNEGNVTIDGENIFSNEALRTQIVFMADTTNFIKQFTVKELVSIYENAYPNFNKSSFYESLEKYKLPNSSLRRYSKGMKTLLYLLLTFSSGASYVILDEPTNGLDPIVKRTVLQLIIEYVSSGEVGVLISSHHLAELEKIIDHYLFLKDGLIESNSSLEESFTDYCKLQVAFQDELPSQFKEHQDIFILSQTGKVSILIVKRQKEEIITQLQGAKPLLLEELPLTLEDLFYLKDGGELYV
ncbi:ABC transporter ATP-binding protein [Bacillus sp. RG28]|uniref:ABC transporter ATP-binding protein n=1 Tax=Gottfriedia endophytica TaxID=2820819 RepID=A0A940SFS0_9BACI|nr:ABC transporter ATP-binding protein [Gottfriedia endophytica]MBP0724292.1 ABC transporter ATP-binding protein [Gottfriedia endophytica]